jgi:hypothetical protein
MIPSPMRVVSDDDQLLHDLQRGAADWRRFKPRFGSYLRGLSRKLTASRRATDADRDDILQETYLFLLDPERPRYAPARSAARTYLHLAVQTAIHAALDHRRLHDGDAADLTETDVGDPTSQAETALPSIKNEYEEREFVAYVVRDLDPGDLRLVEDLVHDRTIQDLSTDHGVSRPTMSRTIRRLRDGLHERAASALSA